MLPYGYSQEIVEASLWKKPVAARLLQLSEAWHVTSSF